MHKEEILHIVKVRFFGSFSGMYHLRKITDPIKVVKLRTDNEYIWKKEIKSDANTNLNLFLDISFPFFGRVPNYN